MKKPTKVILGAGVVTVVLLFVIVAFQPSFFYFFTAQADGILRAGTWEDDAKNWNRAFNEVQPAQVKVIHSKYWKSDHFTEEFVYYFEVELTSEWRDAFLKKHGLTHVPSIVARSFRTNIHSDGIPDWFAPDPVELYDVWDKPGYFGSAWVNKTNGHFFFYDIQL